MGRLFFGFLILFMSLCVSARVDVYLAPDSWVQSTDSVGEIQKYLDDKAHDRIQEGSDNPKEINGLLEKYRGEIEEKTDGMFGLTEAEKYKSNICKLSVTTANTSDVYNSPTNVISLSQLANNKEQACTALTRGLQRALEQSAELRYPPEIKKYGQLSIDLIFVFE